MMNSMLLMSLMCLVFEQCKILRSESIKRTGANQGAVPGPGELETSVNLSVLKRGAGSDRLAMSYYNSRCGAKSP